MPVSEYELIENPADTACSYCVLREDCINTGTLDLLDVCGGIVKATGVGFKFKLPRALILVHKLTGEIVTPEELVTYERSK